MPNFIVLVSDGETNNAAELATEAALLKNGHNTTIVVLATSEASKVKLNGVASRADDIIVANWDDGTGAEALQIRQVSA